MYWWVGESAFWGSRLGHGGIMQSFIRNTPVISIDRSIMSTTSIEADHMMSRSSRMKSKYGGHCRYALSKRI